MSIICQCVLKLVAYHHVLINAVFILILCKEIICHLKCMTSIIIIRINNGKRSINHIDTAHDRMSGSPWLHTSFRNCKAFRKIMQILEYKFHLDMLTHTISDSGTEISLILLLYNKYNFFKPCLNSIIDRKINDNVPVLINRIDLLQATISASHTCCHYYQYRLFHVIAASHFLFVKAEIPDPLCCLFITIPGTNNCPWFDGNRQTSSCQFLSIISQEIMNHL